MTTLGSFNDQMNVLVVGASGAIGGALVDRLASDPRVACVRAWARAPIAHPSAKVETRSVDILDETSIQTALTGLQHVDLAIVATGLLHDPSGMTPEKSWRALDKDMLLRSFAANAVGPALLAKHVLPLLPRQGKSVFAALSARVGSISDNRLGGWCGYRASKAALNPADPYTRHRAVVSAHYRSRSNPASMARGRIVQREQTIFVGLDPNANGNSQPRMARSSPASSALAAINSQRCEERWRIMFRRLTYTDVSGTEGTLRARYPSLSWVIH